MNRMTPSELRSGVRWLVKYGVFEFDCGLGRLRYSDNLFMELAPTRVEVIDTASHELGTIDYDSALGQAISCMFYAHRQAWCMARSDVPIQGR